MKFKPIVLPAVMVTAWLITACGGGSSSSTSIKTTEASSSRLSGMVAKGMVQHGLVVVSEWVNGKWITRAETETDDAGAYAVALTNYQQGPLKLAAFARSTSQMKCDAEWCGSVPFGEPVALYSSGSTTFEMDTIIPGPVSTPIPVTPYTHMVAAYLEQLAADKPAALTSQAIAVAGDGLSQFTGFPVLTTPVIDITDPEKFAAAARNQQLAGLLGAAVIKIANRQATSPADVLQQLAQSYQNGQFDVDDAIPINSLLAAWREVASDPQLLKVVAAGKQDVIGLLKSQIMDVAGQCQLTNSCAPLVVNNSSKSDLQKAKELVGNSRSFIYNLIEANSDKALKNLGGELNNTFFERNSAAMVQLMGTVVGKVVTTLSSDSALQDEIVEMRKGHRDSVVRTIEIKAADAVLGELTLTATQDTHFKVAVTGSLQGDKTAGREVAINLVVTTDFDLLSLMLTTAANETFKLGLSGSLSDSTSSLTINGGDVLARINGPVSSNSDSSLLNSLQLQDLALTLRSATGVLSGKADVDLVAVDKSLLSSYFYDGLPPLSLARLAVDGDLSTTAGTKVKANFELTLDEADKLDMLAYLNGEEVVEYKRSNVLSQAEIHALRNKSLALNVPGNWAINYGESNVKEGSGAIVHQEYAESLDVAQELSMLEEYGAFSSVFDLTTQLKSEFASIPDLRIQSARMHVTGKGNTATGSTLSGRINLGAYENDKRFLKAELTSSLDLAGIDELPMAKLSAWVKRDKLKGGSLNLLARWEGKAYNFYLQDLDLRNNKCALTVSDPYGSELVLDSIDLDSGKGSGAIYVSGKKMADVETVRRVLKISYIDGYFETLQ